ncbi:MAG: ribbon-helix-helix protein, CopG family [Solirubrobacteraceae bacterium]
MTARIGPVGRDIDLDKEEIRLPDGSRLTEETAEQLAERALEQRRAGRPSLVGGSAHTPSLTVRVRPGVRSALEEIARKQGRRLADISREALDEYVARHR